MGVFVELLDQTTKILLDLDAAGKDNLSTLEGKILCLDITVPSVTIYIEVLDKGLKISDSIHGEYDVRLQGPITAFTKLTGANAGGSIMSNGQLSIEGDIETAQNFAKILSELDLDWEELAARFIGDTAARKVGNLCRDFSGWVADTSKQSANNFAEYLQEEKQLLVTNLAAENFQTRLSELRADVDRLQQRIRRLKKQLSPD